MTSNMQSIIVIVLANIFFYTFLYAWGNFVDKGIYCPDIYGTYNQTNATIGKDEIFDTLQGKCTGLPTALVLGIQIPLTVSLAYALRLFVGAT